MTEFYNSEDNVNEYIKLAEDVSSEEIINQLKQHIASGVKVLELGSGPGTDWQLLNQSFKTTGSDLSNEFLAHLKKTYPDGEFLHLDAVTIDTQYKFDAIYSNKVLHHLNDTELKKSILRQSQILQPGGVVCHSFWNGKGDEIFKGMYVNYHLQEELKTLFLPHFNILETRLYKEFEEDDSVFIIAKLRV